MHDNNRITWLYSPLVTWIRPNAVAAFVWTVILALITISPLLFTGQANLIKLRPFGVCFIGLLCELLIAQVVIVLYAHMKRDLPLAISNDHAATATAIVSDALAWMNKDRSVLKLFLGATFFAVILILLSFYQVIDEDDYGFLYFLPKSWYLPASHHSARLLSLILLAISIVPIWCVGFWFNIFHWRMFQKLLNLRLAESPILIYSGFSKLWIITNISSLAMLSSNVFLVALLGFKPHPFQLVISSLITMPGVLGLLWPTYHLYRVLINAKERWTEKLLAVGSSAYGPPGNDAQSLSYSTLYNNLFVERNVGNVQTAVSLGIGLVSFVLGLQQLIGLGKFVGTL